MIKYQSIPISGMCQLSRAQMDDFGLIILPPQAEPGGKDCSVKELPV
jgi:hypothetical protein